MEEYFDIEAAEDQAREERYIRKHFQDSFEDNGDLDDYDHSSWHEESSDFEEDDEYPDF